MRAVLVFCEGKHDIVFVERSLGACANCRRMKRPIRELPSPFGRSQVGKGLIVRRLDDLAVEDIALYDSYPPTPQFESVVEGPERDVIFVLIRVGTKDNAKAALNLIRGTDALMLAPAEHDITEHAVAFLFDADDDGLSTTVAAFRRDYASYYGDLDGMEHAQWLRPKAVPVPVGLYVFHAEGKETGTLENNVAPMVATEWPERYDAARRFIDQNSIPGQEVLKNEARRLKAVITAAGQFDHPGGPLGTVLARGGLPAERYRESSAANDLVSFLLATPWRSIGSAGDGAAIGARPGGCR